jgi:thioredoxin-dependent peroxiredoxin
MLAEGSLAPDFDLPAHDGTRVRLSDLAGRHVLLWFYPEADTPG